MENPQPPERPPPPAENERPAYPPDFLSDLEQIREFIFESAFRILGSRDSAEDVAQESLVRVLRKLMQDPGSVRDSAAYVCGIAHHVISDVLDREKRATEFNEERMPPGIVRQPGILPHQSPQTETLTSLVAQEVEKLPEAEKQVLKACFFEGLRCSEISRRTAEPASRLRKRKSRAIRRLRDQIRNRPELSALRHWGPN